MTLHTAARQALDALDKISRWTGEFPDTGRKHEDGSTMSYAFCFGSNGERDFMRQVAARGYDTLRAALSAEDAQPVALDVSREAKQDAMEVFDAEGPETLQIVRDKHAPKAAPTGGAG